MRQSQPAANRAAAKKQPASSANAPRKSRGITPDKALANTRALLEAKKERVQQGPSYPTTDPAHNAHTNKGFMSNAAQDRAREQEQGNLINTAIHGFDDNTNREHH